MINDLTIVAQQAGYKWKPSSLEVMTVGELKDVDAYLYTPGSGGR